MKITIKTKNEDNEIEEEIFHKNFLTSINKLLNEDNNNTNKKTNENNDLIYLEDNNEFMKENDFITLSTEEMWRNLQKKKIALSN